MAKTGKGVILVGIVAVAISIIASAVAWWRWERTQVVAGNISLPPGTVVTRSAESADGVSGSYNYTCRNPKSAAEVRRFFKETLEEAGWTETAVSELRFRYRLDSGIVRLVLHPQKRFTVFTLSVKPGNSD